MQYYDAAEDIKKGYTFNFVIGGRGVGKTYSRLLYAIKNKECIIYLRRTEREIELINKGITNPYTPINADYNTDYGMEKIGELSVITDKNNDDYFGGYAFALSTFANVRGADMSRCTNIIFDEFIPEKHKQRMKGEADAFFNLYESVNRNRELQGKEPCKVTCYSNAVTLNSPILIELGLTSRIENMLVKNMEYWADDDRSILIHLVKNDEFMEEKKKTALYRLTEGTQFYKHALNNEFAYDTFYNVKHRPLKEYVPLCAIDNVYIYRHKSNNRLYACYSRADCPEYTTKDSLALFRRNHGIYVREALISGKLDFSEFSVKILLTDIFSK